MKTCTKCHQTKPLEEFGRDNRRPNGRRSQCKECQRALCRAYHETNRDRLNAQRAERYAADLDREREQGAAYYAANAERRRAHTAAYWVKKPHARWEQSYRRRARQFGHAPVVESFTRAELVAAYGDACVDCGGPWTDVEHVIPVSAGGPHTLANCRPCCSPCNRRRQTEYNRLTTTEGDQAA